MALKVIEEGIQGPCDAVTVGTYNGVPDDMVILEVGRHGAALLTILSLTHYHLSYKQVCVNSYAHPTFIT